jgi:hypothetical protein
MEARRQCGGANRTEKVLHRIRDLYATTVTAVLLSFRLIWSHVKKGCKNRCYGATLSCTPVLHTFCVEPSIGSCFMARCCRAVTACDSAALVPHERCTAAVRCAGSALKTRALTDQKTEDFRHLIIINASEDHQRRAITRLQLRWARPRPYIGASTPPR